MIRAFDIGALATYGITCIEVRTIHVGIIPTGSELVPLGVRPGPGQVVESNTIMAQVYLDAMGAHCTRLPITCDDRNQIREALHSAISSNDLVLISAGSRPVHAIIPQRSSHPWVRCSSMASPLSPENR